jgi:hypothetical protein
MNITIFELNTNPTRPNTGQMRVNKTNLAIEIYDGTRWASIAQNWNPATWREWFDYYINAAGNIPDQYTRQVHIQQEMQARFPGRYRIDLAGQTWIMVFDTPADETWFHLQHD